MSECKLVKLVLHFSVAAYRGHQEVVKQLLTTDGVDPFTKNFKGETPLSLAAGNGHEDMVRLLLKVEGSDPDTKDFLGKTPLCWAAGNGHETVVKLLLVTGVDPESKDSDGRTPFVVSGRKFTRPVILVPLIFTLSNILHLDSSQLQWQSRSEPLL